MFEPTHGMSRTPVYQTWASMRGRCLNPDSIGFEYYGGKGIKVCDRWEWFELFYKDMGDQPEGMSLDRIDPNGNYEPDNCRWATGIQQGNNRTSTVLISHKGWELSVTQLAKKLGVNYQSLRRNISKMSNTQEAIERTIKRSHGGVSKKRIQSKLTHGHSSNGKRSPTYCSWANMKQRALQVTHPAYKNYGAKGIIVCERWFKFANFLADMGEKPKGDGRRVHIHRKDTKYGYEPDNCVWAYYNGEEVIV